MKSNHMFSLRKLNIIPLLIPILALTSNSSSLAKILRTRSIDAGSSETMYQCDKIFAAILLVLLLDLQAIL
jgi:hypothetical protein